MKYYYVICYWLFFSFSLVAQEYDLSGMHGLPARNGITGFELSGYRIYISEEKGTIYNEKNLKSIKKKYKIKDAIAEYKDEKQDLSHIVIESLLTTKEQPEIQGTQLCYIFQQSENKISVICFYTYNPREIILEQEIIATYLTKGLTQYINEDASSIEFAGRCIKLGNRCEWVSPNNLRCGGGQVSWSEFPSFEKAMLDNELRVMVNANTPGKVILMEEELDVLFEGIPAIAYRVVYAQNSSYPLIVYYIVEEVRGRYLSCVLSNYGYNRYDYDLANLLEEFMIILELPEDAYNKFDTPELEILTKEQKKEVENPMNFWEIRAGTWLPMGTLSNKFSVAPSFGFSMGAPIAQNTALDLLVQLAFPINCQPFEYYYSRYDYDFTKTDLLVNMGLRLRRQIPVANNVYLTSYGGFGVNFLTTDLEKEEYTDDEDKYHSIATIDVLGGLSIRYKKVGCFLEYHYSPYAIANKVNDNFGSNAIHLGINVSF